VTPEPIKVGVIGVGSLGIHHVRCLFQSPLADLVGIHEHHEENAERALEYGAPNFPNYPALLGEIDAIVVATPTQSHREVAGQALEAGKHLLVEKPMGVSARECDELLDLSRKNKRVLHVGHVERMNPAVRAALPRIDKPRFIESHRLAGFVPRGVDVDVILDLMIHDLDLVLDWMGEEPETVHAAGVSVLSGRTDIANARLEFPDGGVANLTASRVSQEKMRKIRVFQDNAYLSIDCLQRETEIIEADRGAIAAIQKANPDTTAAAKAVARDLGKLVRQDLLPSPDGEPIALELEAFLRACHGLPPLTDRKAADGFAARRAVAVAEELAGALREKTRLWVG
jgi:predicted dehydrogenase